MRIAMRAIPDLAEQDRASHHPAHVAYPHNLVAVCKLQRLHIEAQSQAVEDHLHRLHPQVCAGTRIRERVSAACTDHNKFARRIVHA